MFKYSQPMEARQGRTSAVRYAGSKGLGLMAVRPEQRRAGVATDPENRHPEDFYYTPPEAVQWLLKVEDFTGRIWEPACGEGHISEALIAAGHDVVSTDLIDRGYGQGGVDFLAQFRQRVPNIITNPPFKHALPFLRKAVALSTDKVAMFLRVNMLAGQRRGDFYRSSPLANVWVFSGRVSTWRGGVVTSDAGGTNDFAWYVWRHGHRGRPRVGFIDNESIAE